MSPHPTENRLRTDTSNPEGLRDREAKEVTTVRISPAGRKRINERAAKADVGFGHMLRRMLAYSDMHMPDGWVPPQTSGPGRER